MSEQVDWSKYRMDCLKHVVKNIQPELKSIEDKVMNDIEICEVNILFQRFKDFIHEIETIKAQT